MNGTLTTGNLSKCLSQETKNGFFNTHLTIEKLRSVNFLNEEHFRSRLNSQGNAMVLSSELRGHFNIRNNVSLQYAIVRRLHNYATLTDDVWRDIINNGVGLLRTTRNLQEYLVYRLNYK